MDCNKTILPGRKLYFLQHEYSKDEYDYVTNIGIFVKRSDAKKTIRKFKKNFMHNYPLNVLNLMSGFSISKYILNEDNWKEGFFEY